MLGTTWDGSGAEAQVFLESCAELSAEDVVWDQDNVGPTGWEPDFD
jgi:hypothetical protein